MKLTLMQFLTLDGVAQSLLAAGLIDEMRLVIAPVVLGNGRRLFPVGGAPAGLRLLRNETTPCGLAVHVYESAGPPTYRTYGASTWVPPRIGPRFRMARWRWLLRDRARFVPTT